MEIDKLIKKYQDKLININEARASDNKAGDHTFNMEYDEAEKNINEFIVDLKELEAINYTRCCTELPDLKSKSLPLFIEEYRELTSKEFLNKVWEYGNNQWENGYSQGKYNPDFD
tara:strand:+ start:128 stop:472 length:345 start_codon:yes stop_codon:yes gene_type:complete